MKNLWILLLLFNQALAGGWNDQHDPAALIISYENELDKLPLQGKLAKIPWSGSYWPTYLGGTSYRWLYPGPQEDPQKVGYKLLDMKNLGRINVQYLSPSEKYDLFMGDKNWTLTKFERKRTKILRTVKGNKSYKKNYTIPKWWGLCHDWAPATILYKNPAPMILKGKNGLKIPFGSADIKALLLTHMEMFNRRLLKKKIDRPEYYEKYFLGGRCDVSLKLLWEKLEKKEISYAKFNSEINSQNCTGPNAGSFHLALTNLIGIKKLGFIMDMDRFDEVWNQPIYSYQSLMGPPKSFRDKKNKFKPTHKREVTTKVVYISEVESSYQKAINPQQFKEVIYRYEIHTNLENKIVGGRWAQKSKEKDRPDFLWMIKMPYFRYGLTGLQDIYFESTGQKIDRKAYSRTQLKALFKKAMLDIREQLRVVKVWKKADLKKEFVNNRKRERQGFFSRMKAKFKKFAARFK